jgi:hypothetical protein
MMNPIEETVDAVLSECGTRRLRLWLGNLRDLQMDLGQWSGLIFLRAQAYPGEWQPDREELLSSVRARHESEGIGLDPDVVTASLLLQARNRFAADLVGKGVPRELATRAGEMLSFSPPVQQWRM